MFLPFMRLDAHVNDHVASNWETPCHILRCDENLNSTGLEQPLFDALALLVEGPVVVTDTMLQSLRETAVSDVAEMWLKIGFINVEESIVVIVGVAMREDIVSSQATLTSRWHKT